jgi:ABC-2 type transport system ATP-binding protein
MSDVERLADSVAIVHQGRLLIHAPLDDLKERVRQVVVPREVEARPRGIVRRRVAGGEVCMTLVDADPKELEQLHARSRAVEERALGLEEIFIDLVEGAKEREVA